MAINLEDRVKGLEAKVAELYDREALRDLRYRYHECINEARLTEIPDLFTEDGELDFGHLGKAKGPEQIKAFFSGLGRDRSAT
jgi:SnoaL-like domain